MNDKKITFNAIDFEASTGLRTSACAVAIVRVEQAEIKEVWSTLIKPPNNYYSQMCIDVHGLTPQCTINAQPFHKIYPEIIKRIDGMPIVAHNARYDKSVFDACRSAMFASDTLNMTEKWYCTYKLYKSIREDKSEGLKLNNLCDKYGISLNHHDATSDALACAHLFIHYLRNHIK